MHPSQLGNLKKAISVEMKKKLDKWDHERQGVIAKFVGKFQVLDRGEGRLIDTSPFVHYRVRYTATYIKPKVGAKLYGTVQSISGGDGRTLVVVNIEGGLSAIVNTLNDDLYTLSKGEGDNSSS